MRGSKTVTEMWNYLERVYQQSILARKFQYENDIPRRKENPRVLGLVHGIQE